MQHKLGGLEEGKESEGKKPKEVEQSAEDTQMEDANQNGPNWKPRPVADPMDPVEVGNRALFITKEKSERITSKVEIRLSTPQNIWDST